MATATITVILPTTRADGSAFGSGDYGGGTVYRDGVAVAQLVAPSLTATDAGVVPGVSVYTATIFDTQSPAVTSGLSQAVTAPGVVVPVLAAPSAPGLTVTVA